MRTLVALLTAAATLCSPVFGWSEAGHKMVASIAFRRLTAGERQKIASLLEQHPRFQADFKDKLPENLKSAAEQQEWLFQQAANWPDVARYFTDDLKTQYDRPAWHYINRPHFLSDADRAAMQRELKLNLLLLPPATAEPEMNVVQTIRFARSALKSPQATAEDKGLLLSWLFHTVGDIHQPLHSTALFTPNLFPLGDRGGNSIRTEQRGNLHALWDQFPGQRMQFDEARNRAIEDSRDQAMLALGKQAGRELDEAAWLDESHQIATTQVYDAEIVVVLRKLEAAKPEELPAITLSETYLKAGGQIARQRVVQAGFRLGAILKEIAN